MRTKGQTITLKKNIAQEQINAIRAYYLSKPEISQMDVVRHLHFAESIVHHFCKGLKEKRAVQAAQFAACIRHLTEEGRIRLSENGRKSSQKSGKCWTTPERLFFGILNELGIGVRVPAHITEIFGVQSTGEHILYQFPIQRYVCDYVSVSHQIVFNINGDFWHANPFLYNAASLTAIQKWNVYRDVNKRLYLERHGWRVIDIWQSEIEWDVEYVKTLVRTSLANQLPPSPTEDWSDKLKTLWFKPNKKSQPKSEPRSAPQSKTCSCPRCGGEMLRTSLRCAACYRIDQQGYGKPLREILEKLVWEKPMTGVGKDLGVTHTAIKRWCVSYGITPPSRRYWGKRRMGASHEEALQPKPPKKPSIFLTPEKIYQIRIWLRDGVGVREIGRRMNICHTTVIDIKHNKSYKNVGIL